MNIIILSFLFGISLMLNIALLFFLRIKYADCGNIFKIFHNDNVARKVAQKKEIDDFWSDNL